MAPGDLAAELTHGHAQAAGAELGGLLLGSGITWGLARGWWQLTHPSLHKDRGVWQPDL